MECPRWRLTTPHYINVPVLSDGTKVEWEHKEQNRDSGRTVRKLYEVPLLLDPRTPTEYDHPDGGIVVSHMVEGAQYNRRDLIFVGDPTPDMEPLNDEAEAITNSLRPKWDHPIDTLPANGGMNAAERAFMESMMKAFAQSQPQVAPAAGVTQEQYDALKAELDAIKAMLAGQTKPETSATGRRV